MATERKPRAKGVIILIGKLDIANRCIVTFEYEDGATVEKKWQLGGCSDYVSDKAGDGVKAFECNVELGDKGIRLFVSGFSFVNLSAREKGEGKKNNNGRKNSDWGDGD